MNYKYKYEQALIAKTQYSGSTSADSKIFSASMLGNELLQNYFRIKYGTKKDTNFEANTFGSICQLGIDNALSDNKDYISAHRMSYKLDNGWTISGEIDQYDVINNVIIDNKVSTETTLNKIKSEGKKHQYALQLGVYKWLMSKNNKNNEPKTCICLINKSQSYFKPNSKSVFNMIDVETYSPDEIEKMLIEQTNILDEYIDNNIEPSQCKELWWFKQKGISIPMRCTHYCSYRSECKYYKDDIMKRI